MQGPQQIDPAKRKEAEDAYKADLMANHKDKVDGEGILHWTTPFDVGSDGSVSYNRWTAGNAHGSAQDSFVNIAQKDANGKVTGWERTNAWKTVPDYYNNASADQYDRLSKSLKALQGEGFAAMKDLYSSAIARIRG